MKNELPKLAVIEGGQRFVRTHPEMFFSHGVNAHTLVSALVEEALILGATDVGAVRLPDWHAVGADLDWFSVGQILPGSDDIFDRILAFPERGQNEMRAEVLIAAFAEATVTLTPAGYRVVTGLCDILNELASLVKDRAWKRVVAFKLNTVPN